MRRPVHATLGLLFVGAVAQSCVLEPLEANRVAETGSGGTSAGSETEGGRGGTPSGVSGTATAAGKSQGGGSGAGVGGMSGGVGGAGVGGGSGAGSLGGASEGGAGDEPPVAWVACDPTFVESPAVDCPSLQPQVGTACDDELFFPEDFCAYCENAQNCPVDTDYVALRCVNRAWRISDVFGIGCCPDQRPTHGAACDSQAFCEYNGFNDVCECIDGIWQCCSDAYDGAACNQPGQQCVYSLSSIEADKCTCTGASPSTAVWSCCPYFAPADGSICYYDPITCTYPDRTCMCPAYASNWSCE
jgi:hypothetical protein